MILKRVNCIFQCFNNHFLEDFLKCSYSNFTSTTGKRKRVTVPSKGDFLELKLSRTSCFDQDVLHLHQTWLRHHCRCSDCYNHTTHQRSVKLNQSLLQTKVTEANYEDDKLNCIWTDGHESTFDLKWLKQFTPKFEIPHPHCQEFSANIVQFNAPPEFPTPLTSTQLEATGVNFKEFMIKESVLKKFMKNIVTRGVAVILNAPETADDTLKAVQRVAHQQRTLYGDGPTVTTSDLAHKDTAYTNEFLELHTDTSYFSEPMGLQVFHLLSHDGTGGANSISDGFYAARLLCAENPDLYSILATTPILSEYLDEGKYFYSNTDVILSHNLFTRNLERVRFNASDMGTLTKVNPENLTSLYEALVRFSTILEAQAKWIALTPGTILFLDNWRTLHGRSEFTGKRSMASVYMGRSDWLSKARVLGIL